MRKTCVSTFAVLALAGLANAQVTNGSFETGDFTGWTQHGDTGFTGVATGPFNNAPHTGLEHAVFGPLTPGGIFQNLTGVNAGDYVEVRFWLACDGGGSFLAQLDGITLHSFGTSPATYTEFVAVVQVTNANPELRFTFTNPPAYWELDTVSARVVPAPASAAVIGLAGLAAMRRRRA